MDFLRCTQIIHESKLSRAHISKNSTTGCFAPCAETPNLDQYIPRSGFKLFAKVISRQQKWAEKLVDTTFWLKPWLQVISFGSNYFHLAKVLATTNSEPDVIQVVLIRDLSFFETIVDPAHHIFMFFAAKF